MSIAKAAARIRSNPEQKRAQILEEAIGIIGERGYNGFTIQELARRCQLTNAGLLYYFGSKDKLLIALLEDRDRRDTQAIISTVGVADDGDNQEEHSIDTVFKALRAIVQRNSTQPELVRLYAVLGAEALGEGHPAREYFLAREAGALEVFTRMVAPHVPHPESTARQLLGLMTGLEIQWLRTDRQFDLVEEWERSLARLLPASTE